MYKSKGEMQKSFTDFDQPLGLQMNPDNRWVKKTEMIPWETIEAEYAKLLPSYTGMPAKPLLMTLVSLLIQKQSLLVEFRKRLSEDVLNEINEMIIEYNAQKSNMITTITMRMPILLISRTRPMKLKMLEQ